MAEHNLVTPISINAMDDSVGFNYYQEKTKLALIGQFKLYCTNITQLNQWATKQAI